MISTVEFINNSNAKAYTSDELEDLSEYLQRRNITFMEADKATKSLIRSYSNLHIN